MTNCEKGVIKNHREAVSPWTLTSQDHGFQNRYRVLAKGHRVLTFMMWLYCDDTSGNVSKKWNKHNSFLFTAAGLPREHVHQESNVHFLSTSNLAPPLEMLDGIVSQMEYVLSFSNLTNFSNSFGVAGTDRKMESGPGISRLKKWSL